MPQLVKEKGKMEVCPICKEKMFCNETTFNDTKKLQWQNVDGKSHYLFDSNTEETSCRGSGESTTQQPELFSFDNIGLGDELLQEVQSKTKTATQLLKGIHKTVTDECPNAPAPLVGLFVKIIADKMLGVPDLSSILSDLGGNND